METVRKFTYLGDMVNAGGGCEAAVSAIKISAWVKLREYCELLHGSRFHIKLKGAVCKTCVRPAILHENEPWCQKESEMGISQRTE